MSTCVIFGGAGFVGTYLTRHLLKTGRFTHVHLADIRPSRIAGQEGITTSFTDVRLPIPADLVGERPEWIFNLAAVHREPGHIREEYYETNLKGARNVCAYAEEVGCNNIYFTSSISVYGPTDGPTDENSPIQPSTPYGGSKYPAELIHEGWRRADSGRRLIISRPGVLYGPGDPGNILRMINAVKRGYFAYPGSPHIHKSYGYIYGLLDSIDFVMDSDVDFCCYNYVEYPTQTLAELVEIIKSYFETRAVVVHIPLWILFPFAKIVHAILKNKTPIHPVRVRKAATATHIIPRVLTDMGFRFKYDFEYSLTHWEMIAPEDFGPRNGKTTQPVRARIKIGRGREDMPAPAPANKPKTAAVEEKEEVAE